jgi:hypothetical protein
MKEIGLCRSGPDGQYECYVQIWRNNELLDSFITDGPIHQWADQMIEWLGDLCTDDDIKEINDTVLRASKANADLMGERTLVERLRQAASKGGYYADWMAEAADRIEALEAD